MSKNILISTLVLGSTLFISSSVSAAGIQKLADFTTANGFLSYESLVQHSNGLFYGTTSVGGTNNRGTIFSFNAGNNLITRLTSFNGTNGDRPLALTLGSDGYIYGTNEFGGTTNSSTCLSGCGGVFSFVPTNNSISGPFTTRFDGTNGGHPEAGLTEGSNGLFYGTTSQGGGSNNCTYGCGTIFSYNSRTGTISSLASFNRTNGAVPQAELTRGSNGLFYGTTNLGTIFSFNPNNNTITSLASFNDPNNSTISASKLIENSNGLFYGTTPIGGTNNRGTIFSFNPNNNALTSLASFNGINGDRPQAELIRGGDGLFYSTTQYGGTDNIGTIFSFNPNNNALTSLASFNGTNGSQPYASLTKGSNGVLYGTTISGGGANLGTIFAFESEALLAPEPSTILGAMTALGLGGALKRRFKK